MAENREDSGASCGPGSREPSREGVSAASGFDPSRWDNHFLELALVIARMSKDPSTRVGAVIVGPDREIRSTGFNGFPRGITDTHERLHHRDTKLKLVVHAELNAILNAARIGTALKGCTLYLAATDDTGLVWGGPPCTRCTVETIQAGISNIVSHPFKTVPSRWAEDITIARSLLEEAGMSYREIRRDSGGSPEGGDAVAAPSRSDEHAVGCEDSRCAQPTPPERSDK